MKPYLPLLGAAFFLLLTASGNPSKKISTELKIQEPYPPISGSFSGQEVDESPDPLVAYRWENPQADDDLQTYILYPETVTHEATGKVSKNAQGAIKITEPVSLRFDFGQVNAGWLEFDSKDLAGEVTMSISEYTEPAILNAGAQHPVKTAEPVRYGDTYRLELNKELYEGVRYGWIHVASVEHPFTIDEVRLVCQIKPTNYEGSFSCNDPELTRIWYTGAYTVKMNLLKDYFGAILMERSDRHSWTGDAHPSQAASMVAFGNFDFVKKNLFYTSTQFNGIASYSLYWVLSLIDYYNYTGDQKTFDELFDNACQKLDVAYAHYGKNPDLQFHGWDERLGAGFENPNCTEAQNTYKMLSIRAWNEFSQAAHHAGRLDAAEKYAGYVSEKSDELRASTAPFDGFGIFAASDAVNAGFTSVSENDRLWKSAFSDRMQRLSYSPFNQYFIIQAMARMGRYSEALQTIDDCWGGQLRYGGTTFFEVFRPSWVPELAPNGAPVNNQCGYTSMTHPWSGGVTKWLSEEVLGIKPTEPGFTRFQVVPHLDANIYSVDGSVPTPLGTIRFAFDLKSGKGSLVVPEGSYATIGIPKAGRTLKEVLINGQAASRFAAKSSEDEGFIYYRDLRPGTYTIQVDYTGNIPAVPEEAFEYANMQVVEQDTTTQGDWKGHYGSDGYVLFNYDSVGGHRIKQPDYIDSIHLAKTGDLHIVSGTTDSRAPMSADGTTKRNMGSVITLDPAPCNQTFTIDLPNSKNAPYRIALYFVDWEKVGRRSAIEVFDLESKQLLMPVEIVRNYQEGKYVVFSVDRPVRLRINQVRGTNAALCALFFD